MMVVGYGGFLGISKIAEHSKHETTTKCDKSKYILREVCWNPELTTSPPVCEYQRMSIL